MRSDGVISIVIITRNEGGELRATIDNLTSTTPAGQREFIIVDDGSTDGSCDFLRDRADVRLLRSDRLGVAKARNFGASHATGDVVLFADAHIRAPEDWYRPILDALSVEKVGAVAPGIYSLMEPERRGYGLELIGSELHARWRLRRDSIPYPVPVLPGCFLAMRRDVFERTGGFDPGMHQLGGNDTELSCRFWLLGLQLLVIPAVDVGHLFRVKAPYETHWAAVVHNRLRMALIHFDADRVERVCNALRSYESFPKAMSMMLGSDVFARRARMFDSRQFSDQWYFDEFQLQC